MSLPDVSRAFMFGAMTAPVAGRPTTVEYFVDPEGTVIGCEVLSEHVRERRAADICADALGENVGGWAIDHLDRPAYGVVTLNSSETGRLEDLPPDLEIVVSEMPGRSRRREILLMVSIDSAGRLVQCMQMPGQDLSLSEVACAQAQVYTHRVRTGADGQAVGYVDALQIDFVREEASS